MFEIIDHEIDIESVTSSVVVPEAGAVATFIGLTRNFTGDMKVECLQYEAYPSMAIRMMERIGDEARQNLISEK